MAGLERDRSQGGPPNSHYPKLPRSSTLSQDENRDNQTLVSKFNQHPATQQLGIKYYLTTNLSKNAILPTRTAANCLG